MPLKRWLNLKITQQFLIFFTLTCILPLGVMSAMFLQSIDAKFSERLSRTLDIGLLFAEQVYQKSLEKLSLSTAEAANLHVLTEYQEFARTGSIASLEKTLNKYFELRNLDILNLYDQSGKLIAHANPAADLSHPSFKALINQAFLGKTVSSIERFRFHQGGGQPDTIKLEYVSVVPIFPEGSRHVSGVLMTGQSMSEDVSFRGFRQALPEMNLRLFAQGPVAMPGYRLLYSSFNGAGSAMPAGMGSRIQPAPNHKLLRETNPTAAFEQHIGGETFKNKALVLRNYLREPIGVVVVSTSEKDLQDLKLRNLAYILLCLLFGLTVAGVAGIWFKRSFIDPVQALSLAAEQVAQGNLETHVREDSAQREIRQTIVSFNKMTEQLQEDQRLRSTFVSTLTHDLRTPLIAQKRVLELYEEMRDELPRELETLNVRLLQSNNHLLDMVNKLLEAYQYEAGKIVLHPEAIGLRALVQECLAGMQAWAQQKDIRLINEVPADFPAGFWDYDQLRRVFQNLVGNALDNIQAGRTIVIQAQTLEGGEPDRARITVLDNGPGIKPEVLSLLFTRYFTGDRRRQKIGSGLGLYICRMILELHGGTIGVESEPGHGTAFILELPFRMPSQTSPVETITKEMRL